MKDDELGARLVRLENRQEALIAGCSIMNETLEAVRDAVVELAQIVNTPPSGELQALLGRLAGAIEALTEGFDALDHRVAALPQQIALTVRGP